MDESRFHRDELAWAHERESQLLKQLAELQAQIRMVLEDQFYHPVVTGEARESEASAPLFSPEQLADVSQFDEAQDARQMMTPEEFAAWQKEHQP